MVPEVLNKDPYQKAVYVYWFGVAIFECFAWGEAYPKNLQVPMGRCVFHRGEEASWEALCDVYCCLWDDCLIPRFNAQWREKSFTPNDRYQLHPDI